jgi:threonine/homoserine/homoserine lactone efflux protein
LRKKPVIEAYLNLIVFAFLLLGSPGPAPMAVAATGAVFGFRAGLNFVIGLVLGFTVVLLLQAWGISWLFQKYPHLQPWIQWLGVGYIMFLAWKIGTATPQLKSTLQQAPTLFDGMILNVINPKAYAALLVIYVEFLLPHESIPVAWFMTGLVCWLLVVVIDLAWLLLGQVLQPLMTEPTRARRIRWSFAVAMVIIVWWAVLSH